MLGLRSHIKVFKDCTNLLGIRSSHSEPSDKARVVVTGLGIVCPLGSGVQNVWKKLLDGDIATGSLTSLDYQDIPCKVAAFVPRGCNAHELNIESEFSKSELKTFCTATAFGLVAAKEALADAKWHPQMEKDFERTGVAVGTGMVDLCEITDTADILKKKGYGRVSPYFVPRILANMTAGHISIKHGFKGPNHSVSTACTTGLHAIGDAFSFIQRGLASVMVCGGTEAVICPLSIAGFSRMRALSAHFNSDPSKASRPFDKDRDGFVMGEGAGVLILESLEHALQRDARIYGEILGYGLSADAHHISSPDNEGKGAYFCMKSALEESGQSHTHVGYINAHATSTPLGDKAEVKAIHRLFRNHAKDLAVSSTKGATGHLLGAAGSVEAIFTVLACHTGKIPPTANLECTDCGSDVNLVSKNMQLWPKLPISRRVAISNSFGFGGTNASIVFANFEKSANSCT